MKIWSRLLLRGPHVRRVLADQVLVSASNFAIVVLFARALGPAGFGIYALIAIAQRYFVNVSMSLIGNPLSTAAPHATNSEERQQLIVSSFSAQLLASSALALLAMAGGIVYFLVASPDLAGFAAFGLAAAFFSLPMLEWCRKLCFLNRDGTSLFRIDAMAYLPVVVVAGILAQCHLLTLSVALTLWGASGAAACLYATRRLRMPLRIVGARGFMARHWRTSMDYIVSFQAQWLGSQGVVYLATPVVGASGIGAFSSVANILAFTNAIGTTMDNALPLRFAEEYKRGGEPALRRYALRAGAAVTVLLVLILLPIGLFADRIVALLLGGAYAAYSNILWAHCINVAFVFASKIALYHERARLNTRRIAQSTIIGSIASVLFVIHLTKVLGPVGLVWSAVLSSTISLAFLAFCMYRDERARG